MIYRPLSSGVAEESLMLPAGVKRPVPGTTSETPSSYQGEVIPTHCIAWKMIMQKGTFYGDCSMGVKGDGLDVENEMKHYQCRVLVRTVKAASA